MQIGWHELGSKRADAADGETIELHGFPVAFHPSSRATRFLLVADAPCCAGCVPGDPVAMVEVQAASPVAMQSGALRLAGRWQVARNSRDAPRYQLLDAHTLEPPGWRGITRRGVLAAAGPLICLGTRAASADPAQAQAVIAASTTVDIHSHAQWGIVTGPTPDVTTVSAPMRQGGMKVACLAITTNQFTAVANVGGIATFRDPTTVTLYELGQKRFASLHKVVQTQGLAVITDAAGMRAAQAGSPSVVIAAEGADYLEGQIDRVDEAYTKWSLRHLQLTHYRVNELGDIQTTPAVHGGLTDFGAEVIRRCNRLGIVVDVAHGTYDLVKRAVSVTTRPIVLSHTNLHAWPGTYARQITAAHAKLIAETGGVIGVWPPAHEFPTMGAMAAGMARMVDAVGMDHVGLGTDLRGLGAATVFPDYDRLPALAEALLQAGFSPTDAGKILGGNYARVFTSCVA
jgi:membrane dipeptidase